MDIFRKPFLPLSLLIIISLAFIWGLKTINDRQSTYILSDDLYHWNLTDPTQKDSISGLFFDYGYVDTKEDAQFITDWIVDSLPRRNKYGVIKRLFGSWRLENLGHLNKRETQIPAWIIEQSGGETLKKRLQQSLDELGWDSVSQHYYHCSTKLPSIVPAGGECSITVHVVDSNKTALSGVLVRLKRHFEQPIYDSVDSTKVRDVESRDSVVSYAFTDNLGTVIFNVDGTGFYSVLPIKKGYEYGTPKGTTNGKMIGKEKEDNRTYEFTQREHRLKIFDAITYSNLKADEMFGVRSLEDYQLSLKNIGYGFLFAWWIVFAILILWDKRQLRIDKKHQVVQHLPSDKGVFILLMTLNAVCILMMLSIANPLTDKDYASNMIVGTVIGVFLLMLFSLVDYVKYYASHYFIKFDYLSNRLKNIPTLKNVYIPEGLGFIACALFLVLLLWQFGDSPEGSSAKVNFYGVQLTELSKFFFIFAIAAFFTAKAEWIKALPTMKWMKRMNVVGLLLLAFVVLLCIYIGGNKDMGPALVLIVTFILMYSIARNDFWQMLLGIVTFGIAFFFFGGYGILAWYIVWIVGWYFARGKVYESSIMINVLFSIFIYGGQFIYWCGSMFDNSDAKLLGKRLLDRTAMVGDGMWDNTIQGGDQIAQGVWALASGGLTGQGLANGNANYIPAFHTDMIFQSIGEVMGFWMLAFILVCFMFLIGYSIYLAKKAAHPFLFYTIVGFTVVTEVQLFVILLGSLGLIPLTGVSVPFMSYGRTGLALNIAAFGIIIGMTRHNPSTIVTKKAIGFDSVMKATMFSFFFVIFVAVADLLRYQFIFRDENLTKTAMITYLNGDRNREQNPRINRLLKRLYSGNIYDRNGVLLATSSGTILRENDSILVAAGLNKHAIEVLSHKHRRRFYPFGNDLFFMLGDMNTRNLLGSVYRGMPYGYLAEERHLGKLRGVDIKMLEEKDIPYQFKLSNYTAKHDTVHDKIRYANYSNTVIVDMLKQGIHGSLVKKWNESNNLEERDLHLTIDAKLQKNIQNKLALLAAEIDSEDSMYIRASAVVLNAKTGELLCSANYPLPDQKNLTDYKERPNQAAHTERDLGLTFSTPPGSSAKIMSAMAAFKNMGLDAEKYTCDIKLGEKIFGSEPTMPNPMNMDVAFVKSSNCYFINIVHKNKLYNDLKPIYLSAGIGVKGVNSYIFRYPDNSTVYEHVVDSLAQEGYRKYGWYMDKRGKYIGKNKNGQPMYDYRKMYWHQCAMTWGQGDMTASPLNMARAISIIANEGVFRETCYILNDSTPSHTVFPEESLQSISKLKKLLNMEADNKIATNHNFTPFYAKQESLLFGGKSGTAERGSNNYDTILVNKEQSIICAIKNGGICKKRIMSKEKLDNFIKALYAQKSKNQIEAKKHLKNIKLDEGYIAYKFISNINNFNKKNDVWYVCNVWSEKDEAMLCVALRIERYKRMSGKAREWVDKAVLRELYNCGYISTANK